ncbi:Gfo/Idh/MocA family protein [Halocatena halophila]|uniref:Gfo/Idh/MocA family protein n=1 Tax=Halocatena halophila TaxID=2814576 RepID=UPI002ED12B8E
MMVLRTAVVGAGVISGQHLTGLRKCPNTTPVGVCDIDEDRARSMAHDHNTTAYTDLDELLETESLDWLHICTPVQTHESIGLSALKAGVSVLIEKPITVTADELTTLRDTAETNDAIVSPVHNHMFDPATRRARALLDRGIVGDIRGVDVTYTGASYAHEPNRGAWTFELPGGEFEEGIPHPLYLALALGGYPADTSAIDIRTALTRAYEQEFSYDSVQLQYQTDHGVLCSVRVQPGGTPVHRIDIHGSAGSLVIDLVSQTVVPLTADYTSSTINRARNNLERVGRRLQGTILAVRDVLDNRINDSWETEIQLNSHFYQIDAEAAALLGDRPQPVPIEQAHWVLSLMEEIRSVAEDSTVRLEPTPSPDTSV